MFESQVLFKGCTIFSPWFPRQADSVRCTLDVTAVPATNPATLKVELFTKNTEETGEGLNADSGGTPQNITASALGRTTAEWLSKGNIGLKELVRYKFT